MSTMFELAAIPPGTLANVSRRFVLKGFAATGALVVGTSFVLPQPGAGRLEDRRRPDAARHRL